MTDRCLCDSCSAKMMAVVTFSGDRPICLLWEDAKCKSLHGNDVYMINFPSYTGLYIMMDSVTGEMWARHRDDGDAEDGHNGFSQALIWLVSEIINNYQIPRDSEYWMGLVGSGPNPSTIVGITNWDVYHSETYDDLEAVLRLIEGFVKTDSKYRYDAETEKIIPISEGDEFVPPWMAEVVEI